MTTSQHICLFLLIGMWNIGVAQTSQFPEFWTSVSIQNKTTANSSSETVFELDEVMLRRKLKQTPTRFSAATANKEIQIALPYPNGQYKRFIIKGAAVLADALTARFPTIRSYVGYGVEDPTAYARFAWSQHGLQGIILSANEATVFIDPISKEQPTLYKSYYKKERTSKATRCKVLEKEGTEISPSSHLRNSQEATLRTYRLAVTCTGEYAAYHGGTTADALAAINATVTRINAVYENDLAISLELVENNTDLIFLNPDTDPYPRINSNGGFNEDRMFDASDEAINNFIGNDNFDIGHLFITGLGGLAGLGVVCDTNDKTLGLSGLDTPEGPFFDIDIVAHEIGHQFGAEHSFSGDEGVCFGNTSLTSAVEPGGGSTIMSYAGLCDNQNVEDFVDAYFHPLSLEQINNFITSTGNSCGTLETIDNEPPIADAGVNYFIPRSTPFCLTGVGADSNSPKLSYSWDQMDADLTIQPPISSNETGPLFRSLPPSNSPIRFFPNLPDLVKNRSSKWEVLPSVARNLSFRFTVRDNHPNGGLTASDDKRIRVDGNAGPFEIIETNFNKWTVRDSSTIQWDVAGTTNANIDASTVDIFLSTDGGDSFPILIASDIPNTGETTILVPNYPSNTARIMVKGHDHIFFDINNSNFIIEPVLDDVVVDVAESTQRVCANQEAIYEIEIETSGTVTGSVALSLQGLPNGITSTFSRTNFRPPGASILRLSNFEGIPPGVYDFQVVIQSDKGSQQQELQLNVLEAASNIVELQHPANNVIGLDGLPTFEWQPILGTEDYTFQLSKSPSFDELIEETELTTNSTFLTNSLELQTRYYWRVLFESKCVTGTPTVFTFTTAGVSCKTYESTDLPISISPVGDPSIFSSIIVPDEGEILDVNIKDVKITHSFITDLSVALVSPIETIVILLVEPCIVEEDIFLSFDDEATQPYSAIPCPPTSGDTYKAIQELSAVDGENISGEWSLAVLDMYDGDGGSLDNWVLEVCYLDKLAKPPLSASIEKQDESCFERRDGSATVFPVDGQESYTYQWSNGASTSTVNNLTPGGYTVTVSDADTRIVHSVEIAAAASMQTAFSVNEVTCPNTQNGSIAVVNANNANEYLWSDGSTGTSLPNLGSGTYGITITGSNGCTDTREFTIIEEAPLNLSVATKEVSCFGGNDGSFELIGDDNRVLSFQWSSNENEDFLENRLSAGNYGFTVTTEAGCFEILDFTINEPRPIQLETTVKLPTCFGELGTATFVPSGGVAPYEIFACNGSLGNCVDLAGGIYEVRVVDANKCEFKSEFEVQMPVAIQLGVIPKHPSTLIAQDGSITTDLQGGGDSLTYLWSTGAETKDIEGLGAGTYSVTVEDGVGCTATTTITLESEACYTIDIDFSLDRPTCQDEGLGSINAVPISGEAPFLFEWNTGDTVQQIEEVPIGQYQVLVTDALGCTGMGMQLLNPESDLDVELVENISYSCQNKVLGSLEITASGGIGELIYQWSNGQMGASIDSLLEGVYEVTVVDEMGCASIQAYAIGTHDTLFQPQFLEQVSLYLDTAGQAAIEEATLLTSSIDSCSILAIQYSKLFFDCTDLGTTEVIVTTQYASATTENITIPVVIFDTIAPIINCPSDIAIEECLDSLPVHYELSGMDNCGIPTLTKLEGLDSGEKFPMGTTEVIYQASDAVGNESLCEFSVTVGTGSDIAINYDPNPTFVNENPEDDFILFLHKLDVCDSIDFMSFVRPIGGVPPYDISINTIEEEELTTLIVSVRDRNNCLVIDSITGTVNILPPKINADILDEINGEKNGQINIAINEFIFPIVKYDWLTNDSLLSNELDLTGISAGEYKLILTDSFGCSYDYDFTVGIDSTMIDTDSTITSTLNFLKEDAITIAPNPTTGDFRLQLISSNNWLIAVEIYGLDGKQILIDNTHLERSKETFIQLSNYPSGMYIVKIQTELGTVVKKLALL